MQYLYILLVENHSWYTHCIRSEEGLLWGAESRFELGPAVQQADVLQSEPHTHHLKSYSVTFKGSTSQDRMKMFCLVPWFQILCLGSATTWSQIYSRTFKGSKSQDWIKMFCLVLGTTKYIPLYWLSGKLSSLPFSRGYGENILERFLFIEEFCENLQYTK